MSEEKNGVIPEGIGQKAAIKTVTAVNEAHEAIINEYYLNGFNGYKAVKSIIGDTITDNAARVKWSFIQHHETNKEYIKKKRQELRRKTEIQNEHILRELIQWAYIDATTFIGLTPEEVKELPPDIKRAIQSFKAKKHTYTDRNGDTHTEETIEIKLIDKIKAVEMINKHIGFYEVDNKQKAARVNLTKIDTNTVNVLLNAMQESEKGQIQQ